MKLDLRTMLKATATCILLTLMKIFFDRFTVSQILSRADVEITFAWIVVIIGWCIYLFGCIRTRRKKQNNEPWHRTEKDPRKLDQ